MRENKRMSIVRFDKVPVNQRFIFGGWWFTKKANSTAIADKDKKIYNFRPEEMVHY